MNILWYDESVNKKTGGSGTKASSNWLDQQINRKFRFQSINTLIRPTDKPKVEGVIGRYGK
jgi:hypothetical protein